MSENGRYPHPADFWLARRPRFGHEPRRTVDGGRVRPYAFRVCFIDPYQGPLMARFARGTLKLGRVAILRDGGNQYSSGIADAFQAEFERRGGAVPVVSSYRSGAADFRPQLAAIEAAGAEAVFVPGLYPDAASAARQARTPGMKQVFLGGDGWDSAQLLAQAAGALDGSYFVNHASVDDPRPEVASFRLRFFARFGKDPNTLALLGYDAARMNLAAMERARVLTGPALRDALEQTRDFPAVSGLITLDGHHDPWKPGVVMRIENGGFRFYAQIERVAGEPGG